MIVYLCGKMTGLPDYNYPQFHAWAKRLRDAGHTVRNPAEEFDGDQSRTRSEYMARAHRRMLFFGHANEVGDISYLSRCDAIAVLPPSAGDFSTSDGCFFELHLALIHGIPVYWADNLQYAWPEYVLRSFVNPPSSRIPLDPPSVRVVQHEAGTQPVAEDRPFRVGDRVRYEAPGYTAEATIVRVDGHRIYGMWHHEILGMPGDSEMGWNDAAYCKLLSAAPHDGPQVAPHGAHGEVRIIDPDTGGEKGTKLARYGLVPMRAWDKLTYYTDMDANLLLATLHLDNFIMRKDDDMDNLGRLGGHLIGLLRGQESAFDAVAEVYGYGAQKYQSRNWERGYCWELSVSACYRHLRAYRYAQECDPESGLPHLAHALFHVLALLTFVEHYPEKDDRSELYKQGGA